MSAVAPLRRVRRVCRVVAAAVLVACLGVAACTSAWADAFPIATTTAAVPQVGALFPAGVRSAHSCTASVITSPTRDLILTAAHCVAGTGVSLVFAPGYSAGATPFGVWAVTAAYVDPQYVATRDPGYDYAILRVARQDRDGATVGVEEVVGAGYRLATQRAPGTWTMVTAYKEGIDDEPIACATELTYAGVDAQRWPEFDCHGYRGGVSGAALTSTRRGAALVTGVIGGLHAGGCTDAVSYSAPFTQDIRTLRARAYAGGPGDVVPPALPDGC